MSGNHDFYDRAPSTRSDNRETASDGQRKRMSRSLAWVALLIALVLTVGVVWVLAHDDRTPIFQSDPVGEHGAGIRRGH